MHKFLLLFLFCIGTVPTLAQWQAVGNPVPVVSRLSGAQLDPIDGQTAWFINTTNILTPSNIRISRTIDGGITWQNVGPVPPTNEYFGYGILEAVDAQHAWVQIQRTTRSVVLGVDLYYTADGGTTWSQRPLPAGLAGLNTMRFFSLTEGILLDALTGALHRTTDGGLTWQLQSTIAALPSGHRIGQLRQISGIIWTTIYNNGGIPVGFWASTDHGITWRAQSLLTIFGWSEVVFRDTQHALLPAPGLVSGMLSSADGGLTWQNAAPTPFPSFRIATLTAIPGTHAYIAGGRYYRTAQTRGGDGSAVTFDDGQTWTSIDTDNSYLTIQFTAPNAGWYVRAFIEPAVEDIWYDGTGRYVGSPLANRTVTKPSLALNVFPNPSASGAFTVHLPTAAGHLNGVRVIDALGCTVYRALALSTDQRLDLSQQPKGLYSLEVQTNAGLIRSKLFIE